MELHSLRLANGIRLVHLQSKGPVAHCGIFIAAGTRDETESEHGIAHFIEHSIFKGTERRNLFQVLNRLENVGADLNAYTTKEETCIYATFLKEDTERALELFQDILFHSQFPAKEIEKEKQVVIDEIRSYQDSPADQVLDDFEDQVFAGHPLGRNILGTVKSVRRFTRENIFSFIRSNYSPDRIVISFVGNVPFSRLTARVTRYFDQQPEHAGTPKRLPYDGYTPVIRTARKKINQVHCVLGAPAYRFSDPRRIPMALLNNMLGGPVMNSRLSLALRERNGLTYHNESSYIAYSDAGIVSIYFGTEPSLYPRALEIVHKELKRLRTEKLSPLQLNTIKKQMTGQMAIARESNAGVMMAMGKSFLLQDRFEPLEDVIAAIRAVTAETLLELANEVFEPSGLSQLAFVPQSYQKEKS